MTRLLATVACLLLVFALPSVSGQDEVTGGGDSVTLNVRAVPLSQVLEMLSVSQRVNIVAGGDTGVPVTANFYEASLEEALDWVLMPLGLGWTFDGQVYRVAPLVELEQIEDPLRNHLIHPNYISAMELQQFIEPLLSSRGRVILSEKPADGIPEHPTETGGNSSTLQETVLVIDTEEVLGQVKTLVADLDRRPRQVLVRATMVEVTLDETNRFGIDFNLLGGSELSDFESEDALGSTYSTPSVGGAPIPQPNGTTSITTGGFTDPTGDGLRFGYVGSKASIFLEALQSVADTNVLANTEVLALNKQQAEIMIGGRIGYLGGTSLSDGVSQQDVDFLVVGTQLRFRPFIGNDGFVRLEINPQRSSGTVSAITGLPSETTSEVTSNVMVRDRETVVIGGLIESKDVATVKKVPLLGYLPIVGPLFSSDQYVTVRTEIIVLITPIILEDGDTHVDGAALVESYEARGEAFRDTFGLISRAEHAQSLLEEARVALDEGDLDEARELCDQVLQMDSLADGVAELSGEINNALTEQNQDQD